MALYAWAPSVVSAYFECIRLVGKYHDLIFFFLTRSIAFHYSQFELSAQKFFFLRINRINSVSITDTNHTTPFYIPIPTDFFKFLDYQLTPQVSADNCTKAFCIWGVNSIQRGAWGRLMTLFKFHSSNTWLPTVEKPKILFYVQFSQKRLVFSTECFFN